MSTAAASSCSVLSFPFLPLRLLQRRIVIDRLDAARIALLRVPVASSGGSTLPPVVLHEVRVARLDVAPELAGATAAVALEGSGELAGPTAFGGIVAIRALDNSGTYSIAGAADATHLHATVRASEPAQGLLPLDVPQQQGGAVLRVKAYLDRHVTRTERHRASGQNLRGREDHQFHASCRSGVARSGVDDGGHHAQLLACRL